MTHPNLLSKNLLFILAACAGASVANLYYAQPMLALIARTLDATTTVGVVTVATQVGYTLGILFILPLGDLVDRCRLVVVLATVLALGLLASSMAPTLTTLAVAALVVGVGATITQSLIPLAADLANDDQRGKAVGFVFSGVLAGILVARTVSGAVSAQWGWRVMFVVASVAAVGLGATLRVALPKFQPKTSLRYSDLLQSLAVLLVKHRSLRLACAIQACLFAVFSAFWSNLVLLLAGPQFHLGSAVAGAFGLVGVAGVGAANLSGKIADKKGPKLGLRMGLFCCVLAFGIFAIDVSLRGLLVGVIILDFGLSLANVANQTSILGLDAAARSRINTVYVTAIFLGGAVGSAISSAAWAHSGWFAVCGFGFMVSTIAYVIH